MRAAAATTTTTIKTTPRPTPRQQEAVVGEHKTASSKASSLKTMVGLMGGIGRVSPTPNYMIALDQRLAALLLAALSLASSIALASPPIDYFVYTSQLASASADAQNVSSLLAPLEQVYSPPSNWSFSANTSGGSLGQRVLELVSNGSSHKHDNDLVDLETTRYAWALMERQAMLYMRNQVHTMRPFLMELLNEAQTSNECRQAVSLWMDELRDLRQWATLMWNSWGQFPPAGLYEGSFTDLGSYRGCIDVQPPEQVGVPQYCMLDFQPLVPTRPRFHSIFKRVLDHDAIASSLTAGDFDTIERLTSAHSAHSISSRRFRQDTGSSQRAASGNKMNGTLSAQALVELAKKAQYFYYVKLRIGACLPAKCTQQDVKKLARTAGQRAILQSVEVNCMKKEPTTLNTHQEVAISILTVLALIAIVGTAIDLLGFKDLECVHGLRFFSMLWVIYGHTILYMEYQSFTHFYSVVETQIPNFLLLPSLNANFSVDTFFVISGILTTYVTWEYTKGDARKFNKFAFLISRYIRLTPQLAIVILCFFLLPLFGEGPMYKYVSEDKAQVCYDNWVINLLYLQSYIRAEKLCIDPSWWLSIEMTFHFVSLIVIIVMIKNVRQGMIVNAIIAIILTFWGAIIHYSNGFAIQYLPSIPQRYEVSLEQTKLFFHRPYPHAASYFIGIALGYVLANRTVKKLTKMQVLQGWTVCGLGLSISLWGSYYWNLGAPYTQLQATLYYNLCQILWPTSIAWIILACSLGHGGIVNSILSARCFVPLGRITYMTYLSHALIIYYHSARMNIPVEPSMLLFVYLFIANTVLATVLGLLLTIVYESPILNLQKRLFSYLTQKFDPTLKEATALPTSETVIVKNGVGSSPASCMLLLDANGATNKNALLAKTHQNGITNNLSKE